MSEEVTDVETGKDAGEALGVEVGSDIGVAEGGGAGVVDRHAVRPTSATLMTPATRMCFRFMIGTTPCTSKEKPPPQVQTISNAQPA